MSKIDFITSVKDGILSQGWHPPLKPITLDGEKIRFSTGDTPKSDVNGIVRCEKNSDGSYFGWALDFKTQKEIKFPPNRKDNPYTKEELEAIQADIQKEKQHREEQERKQRIKAIEEARQVLSKAQPASPDHPYLVRKRIKSHGLLQIGDNLIVPMRDINGDIISVQRISPDGRKKFHPECPTKGGIFIIGGIPKVTRSA